MGWLKYLMLALQYGPKIVSIVSEIIDLVGGLPSYQADSYEAELAAAVQIFQGTGNRQPLAELRDRLHARRFGQVIRS